MKKDEEVNDVDFEPEDEMGSVGAIKSKMEKLRGELEQVKEERQQYLDGWQRCKADSVNARKDSFADMERQTIRIKTSFVEELLPALDAFEQALKHLPAGDTPWTKGFEAVWKELSNGLKRLGVERITDGGTYDPKKHHVVAEHETQGGDMEKGMQLQRSGYMIGDYVIRPAEVILLVKNK